MQLETLRDAPTEAARLQAWSSRGGAAPSQARTPGWGQRNSRLSERTVRALVCSQGDQVLTAVRTERAREPPAPRPRPEPRPDPHP